jgi:hypothetical protein
MSPTGLVWGIGLLGTLVLGIWNRISITRASRRTTFVNTVTTQRIKWIERLRQDIGRFCALAHQRSVSRLDDPNGTELDRLYRVIRLRLNPTEQPDRDIEGMLTRIRELAHPNQTAELASVLRSFLDDLTEKTQELLKKEWEKVKQEAKKGDLKEATPDQHVSRWPYWLPISLLVGFVLGLLALPICMRVADWMLHVAVEVGAKLGHSAAN